VANNQESTRRISTKSAVVTARFLWPDFVTRHGLVVRAQDADVNPCPLNTTQTDWEQFVNHTHILDVFAHKSEVTSKHQISKHIEGNEKTWDEWEITYLESHPDFIAACELGRTAAMLWALKLNQDFPSERFRVYYTEYDNPIVRFHKVRLSEPVWITDDHLRTATEPDLRNALIFDTRSVFTPVLGPRLLVN
jgi:hypothetical protein